EVGASWLGSCVHVLTAGALEMLATLNRTFGPRRAELPGSRGPRRRAGRGVLPEFLAGPEDAQQGRWRLAPGLADRRVKITGPSDRKVVINALNYGAKLFMADFEDERILSRVSRRCSTHRSKACRSDATSLTRWTGPGTPVWHSTRTA